MNQSFSVDTTKAQEVVDITDQVAGLTEAATKLVSVFTEHTTCAITTVSIDPGLDIDLTETALGMIPKANYRHGAEHAPAHLASSIIGASLTVPAQNGQLSLGQWQRIVLLELDGPRKRRVVVTCV